MRGRPPGTPKSNDPAKQTRKRSARERDLCHVKIRITEYLPGATVDIDRDALDAAAAAMLSSLGQQQQRFWTIQRVNGNGVAGNNGVPGPHRHSLAKSDEIKKNSVQRYLAQRDREAKRAQVSHIDSIHSLRASKSRESRHGSLLILLFSFLSLSPNRGFHRFLINTQAQQLLPSRSTQRIKR